MRQKGVPQKVINDYISALEIVCKDRVGGKVIAQRKECDKRV